VLERGGVPRLITVTITRDPDEPIPYVLAEPPPPEPPPVVPLNRIGRLLLERRLLAWERERDGQPRFEAFGRLEKVVQRMIGRDLAGNEPYELTQLALAWFHANARRPAAFESIVSFVERLNASTDR
jgi:hypothetical protein